MGRLFGTNGIRGVVNQDMDTRLALEIGKAIGTFVGGKLAIGNDTRTSADMIKNSVSAGLMSSGVSVVDLGTLPTPALQYYVKHHPIEGGVMITASHNPPEFNGIKCVDYDGTEMPPEKEGGIESIYFNKEFRNQGWEGIGAMNSVTNAIGDHISGVKSQVNTEAIKKAGITVALDCANGAGALSTPYLLSSLGVRTLSLNCDPQGTFPGHPSEPTPEHLENLMSLVKETSSDIGIAQDGDADRTIFVDEDGNYTHGDKSLALLAGIMVREGGGPVVTPVSSSSCVEDVVSEAGGEVVYTKVGAPIVARKMIEIGAPFGGEENGGLIFGEHQFCRDGAMAAAKMLEVIATYGPLSEQIKTIPSYSLDKRKIKCEEERKSEILEKVYSHLKGAKIDMTDGLKIYFDDGWTLIRPSGTEPIFRIFSEAGDKSTAKKRGSEYEKLVSDLIEGS